MKRPRDWFCAAGFVSVVLLLSGAEVPGELGAGKYVEVTADDAAVYRDNQVVRTATKGERLRLVARNGTWLGVSWTADGTAQTGWVSDAKVAIVEEAAAAPRRDLTPWISPKGKDPSKGKLKVLLDGACQEFAQAATSKIGEAIKLDPCNALSYYVLAGACAENARWSAVIKSMATGHSMADAYLYVTESGLERFLAAPAYIEPIRELAVGITNRARRRDAESAAELLRNLRQMGLKVAQIRPPAAVNLHLGMAMITLAHRDLEGVCEKTNDQALRGWFEEAKARDEEWIAAVQKSLSESDSDELLIVKSYLDLSGLDARSISQFMSYAPGMAMAIASGIKVKARKSRPKTGGTGAKPAPKQRFYRRASNYDFLADLIAGTAPAEEGTSEEGVPADPQSEMAQFFAEQEREFLGSLRTTLDKRRALTAKEFLVAALSGEESKLFQRLMQPKDRADRMDRELWDTASDDGLQAMAKVIGPLIVKTPR